MSFSTFTKVGSLYRTTLKAGIASNATALEFNVAPFANIEYPNWFVIEPNSSNFEIIYCPTAPTGAAFTGVVRGINPGADVDTGDVNYQKGHAANVEVVLAPLHRQWNQLVDVMDGINGTGSETWRIGKDEDDDIKIIAQNADLNKPFLIYDKTLNKWLISNDGVSTYDPSAGGSGLVAGLGITINASAIDLDLRTEGGLRNNQGTGSKQADVDPAIVARLDTANTWEAVQSFTADNLQITTDADSANDAVRQSYLTAQVGLFLSSLEAGEGITAGMGVYLKASDGKAYMVDADADESTYSFVGICTATVLTGATCYYSRPGGVVTGLAGLTAGQYYYVQSTAGTLSTTPNSTRYAKVAQAISTTSLRVIEPKFIRRGTTTISATGDTVITTGFYPGHIDVRAGSNGASSSPAQGSIGDDTNNCVYFTAANGGFSPQAYTTKAWHCRVQVNGTIYSAGTVSAKSATGFTFNCDTFSTYSAQLQWVAYSV